MSVIVNNIFHIVVNESWKAQEIKLLLEEYFPKVNVT
jgi:hypothetical protein